MKSNGYQPTDGKIGEPPRVSPAHETPSHRGTTMKLVYYTVRCPRCKTIEKVMPDEIDWKGNNHKNCGQCRLAIKVTNERGFLTKGVRAVYV